MLGADLTWERSIASTSQMWNPVAGTWDLELLRQMGMDPGLFGAMTDSGSIIGALPDSTKIIAVAGHDTQCAVAAMPVEEGESATWSLIGCELETPILTKESCASGLSNEYGANGRINYLKNIIGLWLIQESRREYARQGEEYSFGELAKLADEAEAFHCFIDPDAPEFTPAGDIPTRIREFCKKTGQPVPETVGEVVRCINQSLAMKYRHAMEEIKECTGKDYKTVYMVGGGTQSALLCQFTANACGCRVSAGPIEATVLGNIALQLMASGDIKSIEEAREIIKRSQDIKIYEPQDKEAWDEAYERFKKILV